MKYFSIDIETTGTDENKHQIIEFAAIFEDTAKQLPFGDIPKFQRIIIPDGDICGDPVALNMNARIINILANRDKSYKEHKIRPLFLAMGEFHEWVHGILYPNESHNGNKIDILCAGKNFAGFDKRFLEKSPDFKSRFRIKNRVLDPAILYTDIENDETLPGTELCMERAGININNLHHALDDAWNVILLLRKKYHILNGK